MWPYGGTDTLWILRLNKEIQAKTGAGEKDERPLGQGMKEQK